MKCRKLLTILIFFVSALHIYAEWQAPIVNFTPDDYMAGTQNWQLLEQHNSWIYAANNYGLLEFDGERWRLYGMSTPMRSFCVAANGEIYAGGSGEFGVFTSDSFGRMNYKVLSDSLRDEDRSFGEVWNICIMQDLVYLQTRNKIFILHTDNSYQTISTDAVFQQMCIVGDAIYVAASTGIYMLAGMQLNLLIGSELVAGYEVRGMRQMPDGRMLIATDLGGLFVYDGNSVSPYNSGVDKFIKENQLYCFAINDRYVAFGTVLNGVLVTDMNGKIVSHYNVKNGLCNNTVLSLLLADDGSLWVGMDQGIARIALSSAIQHLRDDVLSYGSGYCAAISNGRMYFGTNQGLYSAAITDTTTLQLGNLRLVEGSQGQVWNLRVENGVLLCCHNRGLFAVHSERLVPLATNEGYWDIRRRDRSTAYAGTYSGIRVLNFQNGSWRVAGKIDGYDETTLHFETDEVGALWVLSERGVMRLIADSKAEKFVSNELVFPYNERHDWYSLSMVDGQVFISNADTCVLVDRNGFVMSATSLTSLLDGSRFYEMVCQDAEKNIWYIADGIKKVRLYDPQSHSFENVPRRIVDKKNDYADGFPNLYVTNNGKAVSGSIAGFYLVDIDKLKHLVSTDNTLLVRRVRDLSSGEVIYGESYPKIEEAIRLPFQKYNLRFELGGVVNFSSKHIYLTRMLPVEKEFTPCGDVSQRDFRFDKEGKYTLQIKLLSEQTGQMSEASLQLEILPPWYHTAWAKFLYVVLALLLIGLMVYVAHIFALRYKKKLTQKQNEELQRLEQMHEREAKEQEMRILQLEHEKAMFELKNKGEKLNGLMLNQISRNELIDSVRTDLRRVQDDLMSKDITGAKQKIVALMQKLISQENAEIDWERFEDNFDEVNNGFMKKLEEMYPELNKNERRLCVYIRMGLYTKEIAPLMGMTTRGVEMMRYRMRLKLQLEPQANLKDFFDTI